MNNVRQERTGWRCQKISARHREWGYNCPAVDLDFMVAEYNHGLPVALIEYKDIHAREPVLEQPTYKALAALANGYEKPLPFLIVFYCPDDWWFRIIPGNDLAKRIYEGRTILSEQRFVRSLYELRKKVLSDEDELAISRLNTFEPEVNNAH